MSDVRTIRVFIASPGDLAVERAAFQQVLEELNAGFGDALDIKFEPLGWEDTLASTGRRSQEVINREIDRCDVFILAMHRRWGQAAPDAQPYSSYTEEEFHRAFARWQKKRRGKPQAPEIFVFFKHIDSASLADAGPQLQKVLDFRKSLEESRQVLYHGFANEAEFKAEVDRHLRAFAKGELPPADAPRDKVLLPLAVLAEVQKEKAEKEQALARAEREHQLAEAAVARAETFALGFAERAAKAALEGRGGTACFKLCAKHKKPVLGVLSKERRQPCNQRSLRVSCACGTQLLRSWATRVRHGGVMLLKPQTYRA